MGVFSSKPAAAPKKVPPAGSITDIDRAMLDLKNARDRLQKYRTKLHKDEEALIQRAAAAKQAGRTQTALGLLRLRKYKQLQASACEDQLLTVMQMVETVDSKQNEKILLSALAAGKDALAKMHQETTVEDVLELMDAIREEHAVEQEITDLLAEVPELTPQQEADVELELAALEQERVPLVIRSNMSQLPSDIMSNSAPWFVLPAAPSTRLPEIETPISTQVQAATAATTGREPVALPG